MNVHMFQLPRRRLFNMIFAHIYFVIRVRSFCNASIASHEHIKEFWYSQCNTPLSFNASWNEISKMVNIQIRIEILSQVNFSRCQKDLPALLTIEPRTKYWTCTILEGKLGYINHQTYMSGLTKPIDWCIYNRNKTVHPDVWTHYK